MLDSHEFARNGYRVAMIARHVNSLIEAAEEINKAYSLDDDSKAVPFPISEYSRAEIERAFDEIKKTWPGGEIRVAVFNTGHRVAKPFLELTQEDIGMRSYIPRECKIFNHRPSQLDASINVNIQGAFAFARCAILCFREYQINEIGYRGCLIFTYVRQ